MKKLLGLSLSTLWLASGCKTVSHQSNNQLSSNYNSSQKDYEEVACAFFCPSVDQPATKLFKTQRAICERGQIKPFGEGLQIVAKIDETEVSHALDLTLPKCEG